MADPLVTTQVCGFSIFVSFLESMNLSFFLSFLFLLSVTDPGAYGI